MARVASAACTTTTASLVNATVKTAVEGASAGDTVCLPSGSATWTQMVTIPTGVSVEGAGIDVTNISVTNLRAFTLNADAGDVTQLSALTITASGGSPDGHAVLVDVGSTQGSNTFRVHHVKVTGDWYRAFEWTAAGVVASGVFDHDQAIYTGAGSASQAYSGANCESGANQPTYAVTNNSIELGSSEAVYIEDSVASAPQNQDSTYDGYCAGRVVFRFNTVHGETAGGSHGADSGNRRGTQVDENYYNTWDLDSYSCAPSCTANDWSGRWRHLRTGIEFTFGNRLDDALDGPLQLFYYRADPDWPASQVNGWWYGGCAEAFGPLTADVTDGPYVMDGDFGTYLGIARPVGYPCLDQPGWYFDQLGGNGGTVTRIPTLAWDNVRGASTQVAITVNSANTDITDSNGSGLTYFLENVDYYNYTASFDGTSGIGVGLRSARPSTCTAGVYYWSTNGGGNWNESTSNPEGVNRSGADGGLDYCSATNTWTNDWYTPYTYPHPLQEAADSGGGGTSGSGRLRVLIRIGVLAALIPAGMRYRRMGA